MSDEPDRPRCELCGKRMALHELRRRRCRAGLVYDNKADALVQAWRCMRCTKPVDTGIGPRGDMAVRQRTKKH